jgi:hypothetical protein
MIYFIYNTEQEINDIDKIVCVGENIGQSEEDITNRYADAILLENGNFGYICDEITLKYIQNRETIDINQ